MNKQYTRNNTQVEPNVTPCLTNYDVAGLVSIMRDQRTGTIYMEGDLLADKRYDPETERMVTVPTYVVGRYRRSKGGIFHARGKVPMPVNPNLTKVGTTDYHEGVLVVDRQQF